MTEAPSPLCINTSLKDSFSCLWHYKWNHLFISYVAFFPFTLFGLLGLFDPFFMPRSSLELVPEGYNLSFFLYILATYFWALPCIILWHRLYLLGPEHLLRRKIWPILTRSFVMMTKLLILVGICAFLAVILVGLLSFIIGFMGLNDSLSDFLELSDSEFTRYMVIISITGALTYLVFLRFSLAICARTIGKRIGLINSWKLTEKNTFRMLCSFMGSFMPITILAILILFGYQKIFGIDLFYSGEILSTLSYIHIFVLAPVLTLPLSAICSQCASFYRHCGGEDYTKT
ncbi:MAG: hypothetical protein HOJ34_10240 [Kordiimonadaceae bacterium]|nr:hypothetical protein [Kordiimonadaceae bacterium]MBT6035444.1 hypothetical protein [Kordiimonadaceae bacterium]MBT6330149.1 hypothetical protein [Kordiimonadaceae bacterium]MBT7583068.1 hypothetical protein [Kordiimonadaceae bacterium]